MTMKDIYNDRTYLNNNPDWHEKDAPFKVGKIIELLGRNSIPLQTVCEAGCGSGEILVRMCAVLPALDRCLGLDISKDAIAIAKKKETEKISFELRDLADETGFFDLLLVIDVIEHIEDYFGFLRSALARSRYTLFHIPLDMCVWSLFREGMLIESKDRVGHLHTFTEKFVVSILQDNGFTVIDQLYTAPSYEHLSAKQKAVDLLRKFLFRINKKFCTKTLGGYSLLLLTRNH